MQPVPRLATKELEAGAPASWWLGLLTVARWNPRNHVLIWQSQSPSHVCSQGLAFERFWMSEMWFNQMFQVRMKSRQHSN